MSALTAGERMARWRAALEKTMSCAAQVQSVEDPIARMEAYWECRSTGKIARRGR
jgi:hypothetical protein